MSPFVYRLEKVLKYRKQKKEEQIQRLIRAQQEVARIQNEIDKTKTTIVTLRQNMYSAPHTMLENYDIYIKHLHQVVEKLEIKKAEAVRKVEEERRILEELEKSINALEKHREKKKEEYDEEERILEMKVLDEVGAQKHYRRTQEEKEEERLEELLQEENNPTR